MDLDGYEANYRRGSWQTDIPPPLRQRSIQSPRPPKARHSPSSGDDVSSSTSSDSSDSSYYYSSSYDDSSDTSSESSFSTASSSSHNRRRSASRRSTPSAEKLAAAAACEAILLKERELKRLEVELADEKYKFSKDVKRRVSMSAFSDEDEALAQMQRLISIEGEERLENYLRRTETPPAAEAGKRTSETATGHGLNRVSAFQESANNAAAARETVDDTPAPRSATPAPPVDKGESDSSGLPPKGVNTTTPPREQGEEEEEDEGTYGTGSLTPVTYSIDPLGRSNQESDANSEVDATTATTQATSQATKSEQRPTVTRKVKVRRPKRKASHAALKAAATAFLAKEEPAPPVERRNTNPIMSPPAEAPSQGNVVAPLQVNDIYAQQQVVEARLPSSWPAAPQPWAPTSTTAPQAAATPPAQPAGVKVNTQPASTTQPWSALPSSWPCAAPPSVSFAQQQASTAASPNSMWQVTANMGPLSSKEFKNLLCSEYVPTEGANSPTQQPGRVQSPHAPGEPSLGAGRQLDYHTPTQQRAATATRQEGGANGAPREDYEPYGNANTPPIQVTRKGRKTKEQVSDEEFEDISDETPPPPPQDTQPVDNTLIEFPPPPPFSAPEMPPPQALATQPEEDDDASRATCCCGRCLCPPCCSCCSCFKSCWSSVFGCLFPCCFSDRKNQIVPETRQNNVPPLQPILLEPTTPLPPTGPAASPPSPVPYPNGNVQGNQQWQEQRAVNPYPSNTEYDMNNNNNGGVQQTPGISNVEQTLRI
ncbi:hypothetical protein AGDE_13780 [Angomonas deanei]|uniref:Uncharacterized protein n=1 Tax=Angomonas deanei TaxID=59799 RepID=A0A7G2CX49_9TRYP|nr:hypothetical protein AGDE_13780 [Angomonas deanei]CAD2222862.1 hypothetical protein, conserved [Angomonas deanei]|eukprot:EPY21740.1 hypothetical protein AGDE_13780 [Angomonas deanei]